MAVLNRRDFIKTMGLGAAAFAFPGCVSEKEKNKVTGIVENPNVLFIS
ncbi:MAG: twin-arginine translocation signal domain-containing protein, partial [Candidatus Aminicenantes bacterium]|nr:twin-arginine translocation signal domain-containing protein [Candidatus Aminicenantes bacterium]